MRKVLAIISTFFAIVVVPCHAQAPVGPAAATPMLSPEIAAEYVHPHELIDVGNGRKMNLFCMGTGNQTVIFDAGASDWSVIWALVQPSVAKNARACSYDRAGLGYSDPSSDPRSSIFIVDDLHKLIQASKIDTPVVLVGQSLGGFNMKLYAALYPKEVAGLVLVDPSEDRAYARTQNALVAKFGAAFTGELELRNLSYQSQVLAQYDDCTTAARLHDLDPASDLYKNCADPPHPSLGSIIADERQRLQVKRAYQDAQASEIVNSSDGRFDDVYSMLFSKHSFGNKPLIVLTHGIYNPKNPAAVAGFLRLSMMHEQTASLSTRGIHRIVPNAGHYILLDQPQAVIDAVEDVLSKITSK